MSTPTPDSARSTFTQMRDDRLRMASLTVTPWWAPALIAMVVGLWVASPVTGDRRTGYAVAVVSAALVIYLVRAQTGIRVRTAEPRQWSLGILWLLLTLVMYSSAVGLDSLDRAPWVAVPALSAAGITYAAAWVSDRWARESLRA